jgi:hypothetical protein
MKLGTVGWYKKLQDHFGFCKNRHCRSMLSYGLLCKDYTWNLSYYIPYNRFQLFSLILLAYQKWTLPAFASSNTVGGRNVPWWEMCMVFPLYFWIVHLFSYVSVVCPFPIWIVTFPVILYILISYYGTKKSFTQKLLEPYTHMN